jgi:tRNA dimethylallyltransferase
LIVLTGPTGVGKTALSLRLCTRFGGEVVSADSRQVYRGMDVGTAKATVAERAVVPHHLLDIRNPDEVLTAAEYQQLAYATIDDIHRRGCLPMLVGGTILYVRAVAAGLRIPAAPPDPELRAALEAELATRGLAALVRRLQEVDPAAARVVDLRNPRRVLRALEIFLTTGQSKVELEGAAPPPYRTLLLALTRDRAELHRRIDARVEEMVAQGLVEETQRLLTAGCAPNLPAMTSLGYREITAYLAGEMSLADAVARLKIETHRYVRHQMTWLRKLPEVHWFDLDRTAPEEIEGFVAGWLEKPGTQARGSSPWLIA